MFCTNCGVQVKADFNFCSGCGFPVKADATERNQEYASEESASVFLAPSLSSVGAKNLSHAPKRMSFYESVSFSWRNYAKFDGRASRSEFWYWILFDLVSSGLIFGLAILGFFVFDSSDENVQIVSTIFSIYWLALVVPTVARIVRRLHDTNRSSSYLFFALIPLFGNVLLITWLCSKGEPVENRFGPSGQTLESQTIKESKAELIAAIAIWVIVAFLLGVIFANR